MNLIEQWSFTDEQKKNLTPEMIEQADAIVEYLKANPDVVQKYEIWKNLNMDEKKKMKWEYNKIYDSMPDSTPEELEARRVFYKKNRFIIRAYLPSIL